LSESMPGVSTWVFQYHCRTSCSLLQTCITSLGNISLTCIFHFRNLSISLPKNLIFYTSCKSSFLSCNGNNMFWWFQILAF
jgi:hypothetical protein